ncbi:hypothetical protein HAX54_008291 [Datura stramonium]|uniref:Uncharacterized protein n=1 Tax=Datura stramonium TaxID=4076 RepID=A0ABS8RV89_DATST|nr:hypothetical protein [Datura stramonium]
MLDLCVVGTYCYDCHGLVVIVLRGARSIRVRSFGRIVPPPSVAPAANGGGGGLEGDDHWRSFDNSVNAVSFGFVATAILISMFLVMAIFERLLRRRPSSAGGVRNSTDLVAQMRVQRKLDYPSPEVSAFSLSPSPKLHSVCV